MPAARRDIPDEEDGMRRTHWLALAGGLCARSWRLRARRRGDGAGSDPGITDDTIKIGGSYPFSGPGVRVPVDRARRPGLLQVRQRRRRGGRAQDRLRDLRRRLRAAEAVQNARRLVQEEQVFALFNTLGTANNAGHLGLREQAGGAAGLRGDRRVLWGADVKAHPWTTGWQPDYVTEARSTRTTSRRRSRTPRSPCSTRTTPSARTC